ncbi:MAG: MBL fold metallo-hydrolase [Clostridia bacterium]|nr:MBL fold metallo-hydrolase [Clostridia bacterium]
MNVRKSKLPKRITALIITAAICIVLTAAILITNVFVPVRYLTAYFVRARKNAEGVLRVSYADAGFGDCILIELPDGKNVLIDGGDGAYPNTLHILKFLNSRGVKNIDYLICSSVKDEHCGGLAEILKYKKVGYAYIPYCLNTRITAEYNSFVSALNARGVSYGYACVGEGVYDDGYGYYLTFLSPSNYRSEQSEYAGMNSEPTTANIENASVVTWLQYDGTAFAFTSDIGAQGLKNILDRYSASAELGQPFCDKDGHSVKLEDCKIVTAPCHAGKNNTYAPWYDLIKPEQAVISVGKSFADYPSAQALSDICNYCQPHYTMYDGDITVTVSGGGYKITTSKK